MGLVKIMVVVGSCKKWGLVTKTKQSTSSIRLLYLNQSQCLLQIRQKTMIGTQWYPRVENIEHLLSFYFVGVQKIGTL